MASVDRTAKGWRARWRTEDGQSRSRNFERKGEALKFLATVEHSKATGRYIDPSAGRVTFAEYAEVWRLAQVHRPGTAAQVETNLRLHAYPTLGHRPLKAIRPGEVQAWIKGLSTPLAPATVEVVFRYVSAIFKAAVGDRLIGTSPCAGVKLPRRDKAEVVPLATEAVEALIDAMPPSYRALVVLVVGTGLRQGEAFGLTLDRVDFLRRSLRVDRQLVLHAGSEPHLAPPKTEASYRTVPLPPVVLDALAAHLAAFPVGPAADGIRVPSGQAWQAAQYEGLLFTNDRGGPIRRNRFGEVWQRAAKAAGLPAGTGMHDLRHFYASLLIRHGESVKVVQARLGHASAAETLDTYSHLWPDSEDRTRQAVESAFGARVSAVCHEGVGR